MHVVVMRRGDDFAGLEVLAGVLVVPEHVAIGLEASVRRAVVLLGEPVEIAIRPVSLLVADGQHVQHRVTRNAAVFSQLLQRAGKHAMTGALLHPACVYSVAMQRHQGHCLLREFRRAWLDNLGDHITAAEEPEAWSSCRAWIRCNRRRVHLRVHREHSTSARGDRRLL